MRCFLSSLAAISVLASAEAPVSLKSLDWRVVADTMRMEFAFSGGRPEKIKIRPAHGPTELRFLLVELAGARLDAGLLARWPTWAKSLGVTQAEQISIRIDLDRQVPWRASWSGDVLRLDLIDRVHRKSIWTNPWFLGGTGATLAAGGIAVWMLSNPGGAGGLSTEESDIPRPGFGLPK